MMEKVIWAWLGRYNPDAFQNAVYTSHERPETVQQDEPWKGRCVGERRSGIDTYCLLINDFEATFGFRPVAGQLYRIVVAAVVEDVIYTGETPVVAEAK